MSLTATTPDFLTLAHPSPGTVVELAAGSQLCLRFRRGVGDSRWLVAGQPGHVLSLATDGYELHFLVFDGAPTTLRLERRHLDRGIVHEVCELRLIITELADGARTSRSASRRSA